MTALISPSGSHSPGYELWTSPITGYRRTGTRLAELRTLIDAGLTVRCIMEPLQSCAYDAPATEAAQQLRAREFDIAGVKVASDQPVVGWVATESLTKGLVREHVQRIIAENLISDGTPLPLVLNVLKTRASTFVLVNSGVAGIATRTDLNKPPVRIYLFSLISLLEMHLSFWVRQAYPGDSWEQSIKRARLEQALKNQQRRRDRNQNPALVDCLQFCDKRDLVLASQDVCGRLTLERSADAWLKRAEDLRNGLAHSQLDLAEGSSWADIFDVVERVEALIQRSDAEVETIASSRAAGHEAYLWA